MRRQACVTLVTKCGCRGKKKKGPQLFTIPAHGINSQVTLSVNFWMHPTAMMCICYSVLCTCIYMYLYELYQSECLSSCTLPKPLLFTGEGRLLAYMGIFCKHLFCPFKFKKGSFTVCTIAEKPRLLFFSMSHGATILFDCIYSSTNFGSHKRISKEEAEKMSPKTPLASNSVTWLLTRVLTNVKAALYHTQDEFQGIFLHCEAQLNLLLHGAAVAVVEKPLTAVSHFFMSFFS